MSWLRSFLQNRAVVAILSAGLGAGAVVCILGIPELWTAEAAGWASAFATTAAVVVALYVGLAPQMATKRDHARRAHAVGLIVYGRLMRQTLHLTAAERLCRQAPMDRFLLALMRQNLVLDPQFADVLLPYFDALDDRVTSGIGAAVADVEAALPLLQFDNHPEMAQATANRLALLLEPVVQSLDRARVRLAPFATRQPPEDISAPADRMVAGMVKLAEELRAMASQTK